MTKYDTILEYDRIIGYYDIRLSYDAMIALVKDFVRDFSHRYLRGLSPR